MKTVLDPGVRDTIIKRIHSVSEKHTAQWGKMNAFEMVKHCTLTDDMYQGKIKIKRVFVGYLLGKIFLKKFLKEEVLFDKSSPTSDMIVTLGQSGDMEAQKKEWITRIEDYANYTDRGFIHPFFGSMTKDQVGILAYKHSDHHLRQFGA
jgi:hypothetical protein